MQRPYGVVEQIISPQGPYMMPPPGYVTSSMPFGAMHDGYDAPPGAMRMRHSASATELPRSGGMQGGSGSFQQQQSFPMYGLGAPMAPLTDLQHLSSPRASQVPPADRLVLCSSDLCFTSCPVTMTYDSCWSRYNSVLPLCILKRGSTWGLQAYWT